MIRQKYDLSPREQAILQDLWDSEKPLTSPELMANHPDLFEYGPQLHNTINTLLDRGFIKVVGLVISGKKNARQFGASYDEADFLKKKAKFEFGKSKELNTVTLALVEEALKANKGDKEKEQAFVNELKNAINNYK